jgi:hypothetical protein
VGVAVRDPVAVAVIVDVAVAVSVAVAVAVGVAVSVAVEVTVADAVEVGVAVGVSVSVSVAVADGVEVSAAVPVAVGVGVSVGVGVIVSVAVGLGIGSGGVATPTSFTDRWPLPLPPTLSLPVCVVPDGLRAIVGAKLMLTLQAWFGPNTEPQKFAISLNGPLVETDWMLTEARLGFEIVSDLAGERCPACTLPNATEAGLTFTIAADTCEDGAPIKMKKITAAATGSLAIWSFFSTRTNHNLCQPETNPILPRPALD